MRNYLKAELRDAFDIAWNIIPESVQDDLRELIVSIKSAPTLLGVRVKFPDGAVLVSDGEGFGWVARGGAANGGAKWAYIFLRDDLVEETESDVIYTILHEIAHVYELGQDGWLTSQRAESRSELAACAQVIAWLARADNYDDALRAVLGTMLVAWKHIIEWQVEDFAK